MIPNCVNTNPDDENDSYWFNIAIISNVGDASNTRARLSTSLAMVELATLSFI